jgi:UDPglucose 6-dehydrogenase
VAEAEFVYLCVPTPQGDDGSADLSYIQEAAAEIGPHLQPEAWSSTSPPCPSAPPGWSSRPCSAYRRLRRVQPRVPARGLGGARLPEPRPGGDRRRRPGGRHPGGRPLHRPAGTAQVTDPASAETIKYASNAFLATKISFVNAIAAVCEAVGADVNDVVLGMGYDKRIGTPSCGPVPVGVVRASPRTPGRWSASPRTPATTSTCSRASSTVNDEQFERVAARWSASPGVDLEGVTVGVWGLTFKARTDDLRDSRRSMVRRLLDRGAVVRAFDPAVEVARVPPTPAWPASRWWPTPTAPPRAPTVLAVLTEWDDFRWVDLDKVAGVMAQPRVVDARNLLDRAALHRRGFEYEGLGRS